MARNELYNIKNVIDYQIHQVARKSPVCYNELYQIGYLGYLKAQKNFNPEFGDMTLNYASKYIRQELIHTLRKEYNYINKHNFNPDMEVDDYPEDVERNPTDNNTLRKLEQLVDLLPEQQKTVVKAFYLAKEPQRLKDMAAEWGVTKQRIHQIKEKGLENLKEMLNEQTN